LLPKLAAWAALALCAPAWAGASLAWRACDAPTRLSVTEQDRLLQFASLIRRELAASGAQLALIARSGTDLRRVGQRYSHAGISLAGSDASPWAVRQLYYACDEQQPRLFDQGLSGFVMGGDNAALGFVALWLLPEAPAGALAATAQDKATALHWLHPVYSANAHAWSIQYQNCNQWVAELLAAAWAPLDVNSPTPRADAQAWLRAQGYQPASVNVGWLPLVWVAPLLPWVHNSDHPAADLQQAIYRVSLPESIGQFVMARHPATQRIEFCHDERQIVVRRDGPPLPDACTAEAGDTVIPLP